MSSVLVIKGFHYIVGGLCAAPKKPPALSGIEAGHWSWSSSAKKGQCPWSGLFGSEDVFVCQLELKGSRDPGGCGILCLGLDARLCVTPLGRLGLGVVRLDIRTWWRSSLEGCWSWKLRKSPSSSRSELLEKTAFGLGDS